MDELYKDFPIRDQDTDVRLTLDLLQAWAAPAREPLGRRLRLGFVAVANWLQAGSLVRRGAGSVR
jgi:hypothetical protein